MSYVKEIRYASDDIRFWWGETAIEYFTVQGRLVVMGRPFFLKNALFLVISKTVRVCLNERKPFQVWKNFSKIRATFENVDKPIKSLFTLTHCC